MSSESFPAPESWEFLLDRALKEDIGEGDWTTRLLLPDGFGRRTAVILGREEGVLAGMPLVDALYRRLDPTVELEARVAEGERFEAGTVLACLHGPADSLLTGERTALNFLQRLSGIASLTRRYVDAVEGWPVRILDTRKTTPGWRTLEKYAVRMGGGHNHRMGLFDQVLVKDNHLALLRMRDGTVDLCRLIRSIRSAVPAGMAVEVEIERLEELDEALKGGPDIILLDNLSVPDLREAVRRVRSHPPPHPLLEASGGIDLATVRDVAACGVDRISVGALTHSAPALDIALEVV